VPLHDALHDGETDAGSVELLGAMQSLKHAEQLARIRHVESRSGAGGIRHAAKRERRRCHAMRATPRHAEPRPVIVLPREG